MELTYTDYLWFFHLKVGRDRGGNRFIIFLNRILISEQVNALPIQKIRLNKHKEIGLTKALSTKLSYQPSREFLGTEKFQQRTKILFFVVFHPV